MFRRKQRNPGQTLVEVMISLVITGVIGASILTYMMTAKEYSRSCTTQLICKRESYAAIETLARQLREAHLVSISEDGNSMDVTNPDGTISRVWFDEGPDQDPAGIEDNVIMLIPDIEEPEPKILARRSTLVGRYSLFSRDQNHINIRFRMGDAFDNPVTDRITGLGHEGAEVQTTVFLRNC